MVSPSILGEQHTPPVPTDLAPRSFSSGFFEKITVMFDFPALISPSKSEKRG